MSRFKFFDDYSKVNSTKIEDSREESPINKHSNQVRYRAEQQIITKHSGNMASHGLLKHEYLLGLDKLNDGYNAKVTITDAYGSYEPELMKDLIQLGLLIDSVRHEQKFKLNNDGKPTELLNKSEMISNWMTLRTMQLKDDKLLRNFEKDEQKQILKEVNNYCDVVFSDNYPMLEELSKNLFHFTVFDKYLSSGNFLGKDAENVQFYSSMFNIPVTMEFEYQNFQEKDDFYVFEKNGKLLYVDYDLIIDIYKTQYQPVLHYAYTDYDYSITSKIEVDKKSNCITQAYVTINEAVKNNVESTIIYNLKQVEL
ncbi:hypothetical protein IM793_20985 [Pedobacter sp. MR2016-19]|uniref:hypothetical protein n=1 Tax=Pedobacter sp. MR2016-19 TaxID=2780089 RepID=UPI001876945C|nr:hypothetical protein [Pedobacter sp. MR2016-19]MBE5321651.1 hypothetical protein [Pedobacter sp. MR2016-19]